MSTERPKFIKIYIETVGETYDRRGFIGLIPYALMLCFGVGAAFAYYIPDKFWADLAVSSTVFVGIVTFNGLILVLSWNAFSRIHSSLLEGDVSAFLFEKKLMHRYLHYIDYAHAVQMICVGASGFGLLFMLLRVPVLYQRIVLGIVIGFSIYSVKKAGDCVIVMQDLVYQKAIFDHHTKSKGNVQPIRGA